MPRLSLNMDIYNRHVLLVKDANAPCRKVRLLFKTYALIRIILSQARPLLTVGSYVKDSP